MSDQDRTEPRRWEMPEEPPVGTVVSALEGSRRWRRVVNTPHGTSWLELSEAGEEIQFGYGWHDVLITECRGRVVEVLPTPAEALGERLMRVARHLKANPELASATVQPRSLHLQYDAVAADLLRWAESIGANQARLTYPQHEASNEVAVEGVVEGCPEVVACYVDGFRPWLAEQGGIPDDGVFELALLARFALDVEGRAPGAGA